MTLEKFSGQVRGMRDRVLRLYEQANESSGSASSLLLPMALKDLGVASEEIEVTLEALSQKNEELASALHTVAVQQQRYQALFDLAPEAYLVTNAQGIIQEANQAAAKLLGTPQQFLVAKPLTLYLHQANQVTIRAELARMQRNGSQLPDQENRSWEVRIEPRSRPPFSALLSTIQLHDRDRTTLWIIRDLSNSPKEALLERRRTLDQPQNGKGVKALTNSDLLQLYSSYEYRRGDEISLDPQTLLYVTRGLVKLSTLNESNEEVLIGLVGPRMPFGSSLTALPLYQAVALVEVQVVAIPLFELATSPPLAQLLLTKVSQRLQQTERLLAISGCRRVKDRLYGLLQLLKDEIGEPVETGNRLTIRLTHEDLANACCSTRVTVTRLLGELQQQGKIVVDSRHYITLLH
ncbi:helix-turn-helix domain-containing protein [Leptolyngbya sp. FACHB-36]|uniref:helix-turn-helix domain-containing protein n=1 Tax=Leptolyngbya sp. FACHB-36 TaxID=2692808 RepID=UPI0016810F30|nr:helix-turn-helix domain-containing protein [Leptolyngbya sp. FACHB-36]MBD2021365.1 helix-turn-helix domain-containing protein [Leptolyngbya sp. FACHB-36]